MGRSSSKNTAQARTLATVEAELAALSRQLSRQWGLVSTALDASVRFNPRLTRSVARYRRDRHVIEIGPRFLSLRARRKEVLCHELAHAAVDCLHGSRTKPHGPEWRKLVELAGYEPDTWLPVAKRGSKMGGARTTAAASLYRIASNVYEHRCPVCQMTRSARRPVKQWRCAECAAAGLPGALEITRVVAR